MPAIQIPDADLTEYGPGTKLFCDFHFGGKPEAVCREVLLPGRGMFGQEGAIQVELTETRGAYKKGEVLVLSAWEAVPVAQKLPLRAGQFFTRINTHYKWTKTPKSQESSKPRSTRSFRPVN